MKVIVKKCFYFEDSDKKIFNDFCKHYNKTLTSISKELNVSKQYLSLIINGKKRVPDNLFDKILNMLTSQIYIN